MKLPIFFICFFISIKSFSQEKVVKVNGIDFNVYTKGFENRKNNVPALIFENGMGVGLDTWDLVIDELSKEVPVFAYERANVGKSGKDYKLPAIGKVSENLKCILTTLNIQPPYILIGHSMGGLYTRAYSGLYPNDIAGLVFIDPADFTETKITWNEIFQTIGVPEKKIEEMIYDRLYVTSKIDSLHYGSWSESQILGELRRTDFLEINSLPIPQVPIYFFMGGKFEVPLDRRSKDFDQEAFFMERTRVTIERWRKFIYASSKGGSLIYLSQSGHFIHRDDPRAVISNIKFLLDTILSK
ncbi:Pimeloyl-ACP methyl ester carboxylesterase [Dyadobacter koreensis]|uniref:Pimeloyl-ACP methyl ester carboxylesterase n=1 Tax=Dyadobacter koreensis TaxID=408657 RepID=A0A1H6RMD3_9BACT|nr:alpha/beta hydrolase [Dyadobacter koreensis]SEI52765.1 Pimeloyl-ACP methyl ester carboxylesterase [Dyadobacter koreensis]